MILIDKLNPVNAFNFERNDYDKPLLKVLDFLQVNGKGIKKKPRFFEFPTLQLGKLRSVFNRWE